MPVFEYRCKSCKKVYESIILNASDEKTLRCPHCGGSRKEKLLSVLSVVRSPSKKQADRVQALSKVNPANPRGVAGCFKEHGSRFGESGFRETKAWREAVDRVADGGPTLDG